MERSRHTHSRSMYARDLLPTPFLADTLLKDPRAPLRPSESFRSVCLLSRASLPLAYLDQASPGSPLFSAHITPLEKANSEDHTIPSVLVARAAAEKRLYAIEQVAPQCYAICRLQRWVTEPMLLGQSDRQLHTLPSYPIKRRAIECPSNKHPYLWWSHASVEVPGTVAAVMGQELGGTNTPKLLMKREQEIESTDLSHRPVQEPEFQTHIEAQSPDLARTTDQQPQDALQELAKHYLDALYLSRTSLAYFAKGPLSRARAAWSSAAKESDLLGLAAFLRASILSSSVMDKKFRDHMPSSIRTLPLSNEQAPERGTDKTKKKRRKWVAKRDKSGFFVGEQEMVGRWWRSHDDDADICSTSESFDALLRQRLARLRTRETFLQIILTLEVLALEAAVPSRTGEGETLPFSDSQHGDPGLPRTPTQRLTSKKAHNLPTQLEALLDKLCIWHSLESQSPAKAVNPDTSVNSEEPNDGLRNFCTEVIVPFYSARVPHYSATVNQKFGGPGAPTPIKENPSKSHKPGSIVARQPRSKPTRMSSERSSTEPSTRTLQPGKARLPSLPRAAADSESVPLIKRESIDISLDCIPSLRAPSTHGSKPRAVPHLEQFSKREVDLTAISAANEAKMRKKKDVEARLRDAVEMLKKPNRALAVREDERRIDKSFADATLKPKAKAKQFSATTRPDGALSLGSRVDNTPRHVGVRATPRKPHRAAAERGGESAGNSYVGSSSTRMDPEWTFDIPGSTPAVPQTSHRNRPSSHVQETPSRGFAKFMPPGLARPPGSLAIFQTPSKPKSATTVDRLLSTPLAMASPNVVLRTGVADQSTSQSIYNALGWDESQAEPLD